MKYISIKNENNSDPDYYIHFKYNIALITGNTIFINVNSALSDNITELKSLFHIPKGFTVISHTKHSPFIATQPQRIQLKSPGKCDGWNNCSIPDIMLGQAIDIPASLLGYNNETAEIAEFIITCANECDGYSIEGDTLISLRNKFTGMRIIGREMFYKTTVTIELLGIGLKLNTTIHIGLVPCHVGYQYKSTKSQCECYTAKRVVTCTRHQTTINQNFWFGIINNITTISICPSGYCNYSCAEVNQGELLLSSVQDDQCGSHRTGPAFGDCNTGYTLSLDSVDCISTEMCILSVKRVWLHAPKYAELHFE